MTGKLGSAAPAANTNTEIYAVPAGKVATLNIGVVNRGDDAAVIRLALAASVGPLDEDYLEFEASIAAKGVLERTAIVCSAGEKVVFRSSSALCSVRVHGFEEDV